MHVSNARRLWPLPGAALALLMLVSGVAWAQQQPPTQPAQAPPADTIADTWILWAKDGQTRELAQAIRTHAAWRKQAGDPFEWAIYQPVVGDDLTYFVVRSENHQWKDLDAADSWAQQSRAIDKFYEQVGPYVARNEHYLSESANELTHWPDPDRKYTFFGVAQHQLKPGTYGTVRRDVARLAKAARESQWAQPWAVEWTTGGEGGMTVVYPYENWAGMADPSPSFIEMLAKSMGSQEQAQKFMSELSGQLDGTTYTIYRERPDLGTPE